MAGGDGLFLSLLRERKHFSQLTLLDISPLAEEKARRKGLESRLADITKPFPFPDNTFGTACALDVLKHLYDLLPALKEMVRVARWVVIVVPNFHYWKDRARMLVGEVPFQCKPSRGHMHWFNYRILQELTAKVEVKVDTLIIGGFRRYRPAGD